MENTKYEIRITIKYKEKTIERYANLVTSMKHIGKELVEKKEYIAIWNDDELIDYLDVRYIKHLNWITYATEFLLARYKRVPKQITIDIIG